MRLSIRDVSRFLIAAELLRAKTAENAGKPLAFDYVADAALRTDESGDRLRQALQILGDQQEGLLRNTPLHTGTSERVMQGREAEVRFLKAVHSATLAFAELRPDAPPTERIRERLIDAVRAIDETPGSIHERREWLGNLRTQAVGLCGNEEIALGLLRDAERVYMERYMAERLAPFIKNPMPHSDEPAS
ncbi:hypothetical protein [Tahibacter amnicola]|uniref:Uncharacterized protein n=1 Tax=Tahibacter amnicola TaxID=2976241 RepID=A0ABY6BF22_9GAMM|nr:hypothetical protein [Tahibacter amnicola]UXI68349.1 hypothetical protein N4264_01475 [Tahibacter amnicola]